MPDMTYAEKHEAITRRLALCRVAGGLTDEDIATQVLEAIGIEAPAEAEVEHW